MPLYTLANFRTLALDRLDQNTALYPTAELDRCINEALCILNLHTGFYQTTASGSSSANAQIYNVATGIIFPIRVTFAGRQLDPMSLSEIGTAYYSWATDTTANRGPVAHWIPIGISQFAIHPIDAVGGATITVTGITEPPTLVNANDVIQLEDEYATVIEDYCAHRLPLKEGGKIFADASAGYQAFLKTVKSKTMWTKFQAPKYFVRSAEKVA